MREQEDIILSRCSVASGYGWNILLAPAACCWCCLYFTLFFGYSCPGIERERMRRTPVRNDRLHRFCLLFGILVLPAVVFPWASPSTFPKKKVQESLTFQQRCHSQQQSQQLYASNSNRSTEQSRTPYPSFLSKSWRTVVQHAMTTPTSSSSSTGSSSTGALVGSSSASTTAATIVGEGSLTDSTDIRSTVIEPGTAVVAKNDPLSTAAEEQQQQATHLIQEINPTGDASQNVTTPSTVSVLTYTDSLNQSWKALNVPEDKFVAFLQYSNVPIPTTLRLNEKNESSVFQKETILHSDAHVFREEWRQLWRERRLVSDRTELLAVYPSDTTERSNNNVPEENTTHKRGGFTDLVHLYSERLLGILRDEDEIGQDYLLQWLTREYGQEETLQLQGSQFSNLSQEDQLKRLKHFLEWFRNNFPYFYDRCDACGASIREDKSSSSESDDEKHTFLGYVYPNDDELLGKASRTELYHCHKCSAMTRFPRYNSASFVIKHQRGRCGEYSMLLFRFLRALGHKSRWVVDWADHVWAETMVGDRWVHLDPCEAAVDENLIYQGWGKKQTYILGFYSPEKGSGDTLPVIEDVTKEYTSDSWKEICDRREESEELVKKSIREASNKLKEQIQA